MRVIIVCAGSQDKWNNHLGIRSHFVPVLGEPLLHRAVRQSLAVTDDVHISCPAGLEEMYSVAGAQVHGIGETASEHHSSHAWWHPGGRTVMLLGDTVFTDDAFATVVGCADDDIRFFGRYSKSAITGTPYGEQFAYSWPATRNAWLWRKVEEARRFRTADIAERGRTRPPGWILLRLIQGTHPLKHVVMKPWWVEIDDETDDIDFPADFERHPWTRGQE